MRLDADFAGVEVGFQPVPAGKYRTLISGSEEKTAENKSKYTDWELTVQEGEFKGRKVYYRTFPQPKARWTLLSLCVASGFLRPEGRGKERKLLLEDGSEYGGSFDDSELFGKEVIADVIVDEKYNNNKINMVLPVEG